MLSDFKGVVLAVPLVAVWLFTTGNPHVIGQFLAGKQRSGGASGERKGSHHQIKDIQKGCAVASSGGRSEAPTTAAGCSCQEATELTQK